MDSHTIEQQLRVEEARRLFWEECPFGTYLNQVDDLLEMLIGRDSDQEELQVIAELQEERCLPVETAWAIAKESFSKPWKYE